MSDPREYVLAAFDAILTKAYSSKNLPKETWKGMSRGEIRQLIREEIAELLTALYDDEPAQEVLLEAADVINFAAMLATLDEVKS